MKVAIVGCGAISRMHIGALSDMAGIEIVAVCDRDNDRLADATRWAPTARPFDDFDRLLREAKPDAVHILTPPSTHAALAVQAMEAGCHVLVEKPMALSTQEADRMIEAADRCGVKLCTNHNYLRKPSIVTATQLVAEGAIGRVLYVDAYYGLSGEASSFESTRGAHWASRLPGGVFTNFLPHLIYLQRHFIGEISNVVGVALSAGGRASDVPTELAVLLQGNGTTGTMTFSTLAKPYAKFVDIYGTKGRIHADLVREVCVIQRQHAVPRLISKVLYNIEAVMQLSTGTIENTVRVLSGQRRNMPELPVILGEFYESIRADGDVPVSGDDGREMVRVMEDVWAAMPSAPTSHRVSEPCSSRAPRSEAERRVVATSGFGGKVLVTGATGFLGQHVVEALWRCGADVVALVRDRARASSELERHATIVEGDITDAHAMSAAMEGVATVFHCAAMTRGYVPWSAHYQTNVQGTRVLLDAASKAGVQKLVHVSSVIVYGTDGLPQGGAVRESSPYAKMADRWAYYERSKIEAEQLVFDAYERSGLPVTVIRPGIIYGPGGRAAGRGLAQLGRFRLTIGSGRNVLPYTYVANVVDAMLLAAIAPAAAGQAYNVVDTPQIPVRALMERAAATNHEAIAFLPVPPVVVRTAASLLELRQRRAGSDTPPRLSQFVVRSACRNVRYDTSKARDELGWTPEVTLDDGLKLASGEHDAAIG